MAKRTRQLCETQTGKNAGAITCKIELAAGKAPEWIPLFPAPDAENLIKARDGRVFRMPDPAAFAAAYNAEGHEVAMDFDHKVEWGGSPAVGWIKSLEVRDGGAIWANVDWLEEGRTAVEKRQYRYISPAFDVDRAKAMLITSLSSAALTNNPALKMPALTSKEGASKMDPKLLALLGLPADATQEQVNAAVEAKIAAEAKAKTEAEATAKKLAEQTATGPALKDFVPRADFDALSQRIAQQEADAKAAKEAAHKAAVDAAISDALKAGKIFPASEAYYRKQCSTEQGLADFREFCGGQPAIVPSDVVAAGKTPTASDWMPTAIELEVAEKMGTSREELIARKKRDAGVTA